MTELRCKICGARIETIPICCGYDITINDETNEWQCCMGPDLGYMNLNELICSK